MKIDQLKSVLSIVVLMLLISLHFSCKAGVAMAASVVYNYDMSGRILAVIYGDGQRSVFTYDDTGNITVVTVVATSLAPVTTTLLLLDNDGAGSNTTKLDRR
jgi:YD repeat-containing protein